MAFEPIVPFWAIVLLGAFGFALSWYQYRYRGIYGVSPLVRWLLFCFRSSIFLLFAFLLSGPQLTREVRQERPPKLLVLFDTSESMNTSESEGSKTAFVSLRDGFFTRLLPIWQDRFQLRYYQFSSRLQSTDEDSLRKLTSVAGSATNLSGAIMEALSQQGNSLPAGIVVLTDGNHNWGPDPTPDILKTADDLKPIPLIAISTPTFGEIRKGLAIPQVVLPSPTFAKEETPIRFQVVASGVEQKDTIVRLWLQQQDDDQAWSLVPESTREQKILLAGSSTQASFKTRFAKAGKYRVCLEAVAEGVPLASATSEVEVEPGKWKIAYFCGGPGWLTGSLLRRLAFVPRFSVRAAIGIKGGEWSYLTTGESPESGIEFEHISPSDVVFEADLIMFEGLTRNQFATLPKERIRERVDAGAAFIIIPGKDDLPPPAVLEAMGIADKMPVSFARASLSNAVLPIRLTEKSANHRISGFPSFRILAERQIRTEKTLSSVSAEPGSETLIEYEDQDPLLVVRSVGENRSVYWGGRNTWKWQFMANKADDDFYQLFGNLVDNVFLWLLSGDEVRTGKPILILSQPRVPLGKNIEVGIQYTRAIEDPKATIQLQVTDPAGVRIPIPLNQKPGGFFSADFTPPESGDYLFLVEDPDVHGATDQEVIKVEPFSIETAISGVREDLLKNLCEKSSGVWTDLKGIASIPTHKSVEPLYSPQVKIRTITEPLMSTPLFFVILIILFSLEWGFRRLRDLP